MSERQKIMFSALALAMKAKCGEVDEHELATLLTTAEQLLGSADPVTSEIIRFQVQLELDPSPAVLADLGRLLHDRLSILSMPDPIDAERKDIYG